MSNSFTPLVNAPAATGDKGVFLLKVLPQADAKAAFEPLPRAAKSEEEAKTCPQPSVSLQRQGDVVTGIRIECVCGQVIELACVY